MIYNKTITIKDGRQAVLRNADASDAEAVLSCFIQTHEETDFLLTYPDECTFTIEQEADFLQGNTDSPNAVEIAAFVDCKIVGTAGFSPIGGCCKLKHRAEMGISVIKEYWGLGIGRALMEACIECAEKAGYTQLELNVTANNEKAIALYEKAGFKEYGRNPKGFNSRESGYCEVVYMYREL